MVGLHLLFDFSEVDVLHDRNIELGHHAVRVVGVVVPESRVVIVDFLIGLIQEEVELVAQFGVPLVEGLRDVVALAEPVQFLGLSGGLSRDVELRGVLVQLVAFSQESHLLLGEALLVFDRGLWVFGRLGGWGSSWSVHVCELEGRVHL